MSCADCTTKPKSDPVNQPAHYTDHPSGVECIQITEHMNFCLGNAVKYVWRANLKGNPIEDLEKAAWYIQREIARIKAKEEPEQNMGQITRDHKDWMDEKSRLIREQLDIVARRVGPVPGEGPNQTKDQIRRDHEAEMGRLHDAIKEEMAQYEEASRLARLARFAELTPEEEEKWKSVEL